MTAAVVLATTSSRWIPACAGMTIAASPCRRVAVSPCRRVPVSPHRRVPASVLKEALTGRSSPCANSPACAVARRQCVRFAHPGVLAEPAHSRQPILLAQADLFADRYSARPRRTATRDDRASRRPGPCSRRNTLCVMRSSVHLGLGSFAGQRGGTSSRGARGDNGARRLLGPRLWHSCLPRPPRRTRFARGKLPPHGPRPRHPRPRPSSPGCPRRARFPKRHSLPTRPRR